MGFVAQIGKLESTTSTLANTWDVTLTGGCATNQQAVLRVVGHNGAGEDAPFTATDTKGNTWVARVHSPRTGDEQVSILDCINPATALVPGDKVHLAHGGINTGSVAATVDCHDDIVSFDTSAITSSPSGTSAPMGTTVTGAQSAQLIVGAVGWKIDDKVFTPGGSSVASAAAESSVSGGTFRVIAGTYEYVNAAGTRSASATLHAASTSAGAVAVYNTAQATQDSGPVSDDSSTGWSTTTGGTVASVTDEVNPDYSDYAFTSDNPTAVVYKGKLGPLGIPGDMSAVVLQLALRAINFTTVAQATVTILCGTTVIRTFAPRTVTNSWDIYDFALTESQAESVTDWTNIHFWVSYTVA